MQFKDICKEKNISPSYTRMRIFDYLKVAKTHPTVDMIYKSLKPELPTLSKTTVYNVLDLFIKENIVVPVNLSSGEQRYEILAEKHSHFKCNVCGEVYDIPAVNLNLAKEHTKDFKIESEEVLLKGICSKCIK